MAHKYKILLHERLIPGTVFSRPAPQVRTLTMDSPALDAMTDLGQEKAVTIGPAAPIDTANRLMIASGVRLLLVTEASDRVIGIITATDLLGEKPMQFLQRVPGSAYSDISVQDIMTPGAEMEVLDLATVEHAHVGDVVATLQEVGRQHAVVVGRSSANGLPAIRGIFSATRIGKELGVRVDTTHVASTFAELEAALMASATNHAHL